MSRAFITEFRGGLALCACLFYQSFKVNALCVLPSNCKADQSQQIKVHINHATVLNSNSEVDRIL